MALALALAAVCYTSEVVLASGSVVLRVTEDAEAGAVAGFVASGFSVGNIIRHFTENDKAVLAEVSMFDEFRR